MKFKKKTLKNGLRVVTVPMKDNPTVTVLVLVETGSEYETKEINGISHFLEHMCFKGTVKRPRAIDITRELDAIGSQYNAFTSQEYTGYYAKSDAKHFDKIFDVVSDIYLNSTFPEAEIEKEKGVITEEINMYEDTPARHVQDLTLELLYGDQPAGWNVAGTKEVVAKLKRSDFVKYHQAHYVPEATIVVVAGSMDEKKVNKKIEEVFGKVKASKKQKKKKTQEMQMKPKVLVKYKDTDQTHLVLAMRSFNVKNKMNPAITVLSMILGGGMSSRLFQKLREEMGVGYYVRSYNDPSLDHGFFQVSAGVTNKRVKEVISAVLTELKRLTTERVNDEELKRAQEFFVGNMKLSLESSDEIANYYGGQEVMKKDIKLAEEKAKEIRAVTARDVQKAAKEIFKNDRLNLAMIGPYKSGTEFIEVLKF